MGFRKQGCKQVPESARAVFLEALRSGLSQSAAATVAGVSHTTGNRWAQAAGHQATTKHRGIRYSAAVREVFWVAVKSGISPSQAAVIAGVSDNAAQSWVQQAGYVPRTAVCTDLLVEVDPARRAACPDDIHRALSTRRAARDRLPTLCGQPSCWGGTGTRSAVRSAGARPARCIGRGSARTRLRPTVKRPKPRKLDDNPALRAEVLRRLKLRHSPEQIAGRLREDFPDDPEMWVSHETIYQALYVQPRGELAKEVKTALRTGRTQRKQQGRKETESRGKLKNMVTISERPAEVDDRAIPGHWEGDLIIGANSASAIGTLVERTTGFVVLLHLPGDHTAATLAEAMSAKIPQIPEILRRSLTWDQGKEMALHTAITEATGLPIYFCDPHSPWQRGTNENTNGLLRQYFPKGTDLSFHGPGILDNVAAELNARPRKRHDWRTPAEELDRLLSNPSTYVAATA